jgi:hypothetical protein
MTNVCDGIYIGPTVAISTYAPLLKPRSVNPHAILLLLFQNAVKDVDIHLPTPRASWMRKLRSKNPGQYLTDPDPRDAYEAAEHPYISVWSKSTKMLRDFEVPFEKFVSGNHILETLGQEGLRMRDVGEHTLTRAWPTRITPGGSKEEFVMRMGKYCAGHERYVECVKED